MSCELFKDFLKISLLGLPEILFRYQLSVDFEKYFLLVPRVHFDLCRSDRQKMLTNWTG